MTVQLVLQCYQIGHMENHQNQRIVHTTWNTTCKTVVGHILWNLALCSKSISGYTTCKKCVLCISAVGLHIIFHPKYLHQSASLLPTEMHMLVGYDLMYHGIGPLLKLSSLVQILHLCAPTFAPIARWSTERIHVYF